MDRNSRAKYGKAYGSSLYISRNNESDPESGVFIRAYGEVVSVSEIPAIIEAFKAIAKDFEKPKNSDILDELPIGSIMQVNDEVDRWVKGRNGWASVTYLDSSLRLGVYFNRDWWTITVKYRGDE